MPGTPLVRSLAGGLLVAALLTACGDESVGDGSERDGAAAADTAGAADVAARLTPRTVSETVLDDGRSVEALLSQTNLGPLFEADTSADDPSGLEDGVEPPSDEELADCYSDVSFEDRLDPAGIAIGDAAVDYLLFDDTRFLVVSSQVRSFGDEQAATSALDQLTENLGDCTHYEADEEDGAVTILDLENSTDTTSEDADAQLTMVGGGSWGDGTDSLPVGMGFSAVRVDNNVTMVMLLSLGLFEDNELLAPYTDIAVDRLVAVASGEVPEEVTGPEPTSPPRVRLPGGTDESLLDLFFDTAPGLVDAD